MLEPTSKIPIRVAIVDDQKLFRRGLKSILDKQVHFDVVFEASNGRQLLERIAFEPVQVVLLDVEMPELDGKATLAELKKNHPKVQVIVLTMHKSERLIAQFMELGAQGFLLKDEDPATVITAIEQVVEEGVYFRDYVSKALLKASQQSSKKWGEDLPLMVELSTRELEILRLICQEYTAPEIAEKLNISTRTVEGHRYNLQTKTKSRNIAGLVVYAMNNGLF